MGKKQSKVFRPVPIQKSKFELVLKEVKLHVKLQMDRRLSKIKQKEKALLQLINKKHRNKNDEFIKGQTVVSDQSYVDACAICMRYIDILSDKSMNIVESRGDSSRIQDIRTYLISVIWVGKPLNIEAFGKLYNMMYNFYGPGVQTAIEQQTEVDPELIAHFKNLMPSADKVNLYFGNFCERYELPIEKFNEVGHQAGMVNNYGNPGIGGGMGGGMGGGGMQQPLQPQFQLPLQNEQFNPLQGQQNQYFQQQQQPNFQINQPQQPQLPQQPSFQNSQPMQPQQFPPPQNQQIQQQSVKSIGQSNQQQPQQPQFPQPQQPQFPQPQQPQFPPQNSGQNIPQNNQQIDLNSLDNLIGDINIDNLQKMDLQKMDVSNQQKQNYPDINQLKQSNNKYVPQGPPQFPPPS